MLAYGSALREQGWVTIVTRAVRRSLEIVIMVGAANLATREARLDRRGPKLF